MIERRATPRFDVPSGELVVLPFPLNIQVLDISTAGVLLQATRPIEVGTRASLRINLEGTPFHAEVDVRRVSAEPAGKEQLYRIGAQFVEISAEHRRIIERFTNL